VLTTLLRLYAQSPSSINLSDYFVVYSPNGASLPAGHDVQTAAQLLGFPSGYIAFCVASYGPAGDGMGKTVFLATLVYTDNSLQRNLTMQVDDNTGVWRLSDSVYPDGQSGLAPSLAQPGMCTLLGLTAPSGIASSNQLPQHLPAGGGGGMAGCTPR
jgi:hypothetical protein